MNDLVVVAVDCYTFRAPSPRSVVGTSEPY